MIKVMNDVKMYEVEDRETFDINDVLTVSSHWNDDSLVVLQVDNCKFTVRFTVSAKDLRAAVDNATNTSRF